MNTTKAPSRYVSADYLRPGHGFCPGCGVALALRYFLKATGPNIVFANPPGCTGPSIVNALMDGKKSLTTVNTPFGSVSSFAGGLKSGLVSKGDDETLVVAWAGDGATFDIGLGALSAAAERNDDILYFCADNEGYQNTGNQRSSASPWNTINTTNPKGAPKQEFKKDIMTIMRGHSIPYAATATIGYADDLMEKVKKAKSLKGFKFLHVLCPCPSGWGFPGDLTIELSKLAVQSRLFSLYEMEEDAKITINRSPKKKPVVDYMKPQKRYRKFSSKELVMFEDRVEKEWKFLKHLAEFNG